MYNQIMLGFVTLGFFSVSVALAYNFFIQARLDFVAGCLELEALSYELHIKQQDKNNPPLRR